MPFCFQPEITTAQAAGAATGSSAPTAGTRRTVCPSGEQAVGGTAKEAATADVWIVAGLGLLGGALASAVNIRRITGGMTPYDVPVALSLLKVPSGALTAVAGILLLGGGFVPGLSDLDSQRQILAYALVFWLVVAAFVHGYEEPTLSARYGDEYAAYCRAVPAWIPRPGSIRRS